MTKVAVTRYKDLTRWDVKSYLNSLALLHTNLVAFGELLKRVPIDFEELQADKEYPIIGVRSYGKGMYHNRIAKGIDLITPTTKAYQKIRAGNLFWCKVDTKNGAFGITTKDLETYYASNNMIQVEIQQDKILPDFLQLLFTFEFFQQYLDSHVVGLTNRQYISFTDLVHVRIPLPPLDEQKKIIALWHKAQSESKSYTEQAETLKKEIDDYLMSDLGITVQKQEKSKVFTTRYKDLERWDLSSNNLIFNYSSKYSLISYGEIFTTLINGADERDYKDSGIEYIRVSNVKKGYIDLSEVKYISSLPTKGIIPKKGLLITRKGTVGHIAYIPNEINMIASSEVFIITFNHDIIVPEYLVEINISPVIQEVYKISAQGTIMPSLAQENLKNIKIPLPPLEKQQEIVEHITKIRTQISELQTKAQDTISSTRETIKNQIIK